MVRSLYNYNAKAIMIILSSIDKYSSKEKLYIAVRDAEKRVVDDKLLQLLPYPPDSYIHSNEWKMRAASFERFSKYILKKHKSKELKILDIGCGNGWMSHQLYNKGHYVTGVDVNLIELQQAENVFGTNTKLQWIYCDILDDSIINQTFDVIVLGASCQYFPNITDLTKRLSQMLASGGTIHLLDSFFYTPDEAVNAQKRTHDYYLKIGYPSMAQYYFHHVIQDVKKCGYKKKYPTFFTSHKQPQWWVLN